MRESLRDAVEEFERDRESCAHPVLLLDRVVKVENSRDRAEPASNAKRPPRAPITVTVRQAKEEIDLSSWAKLYVQTVIGIEMRRPKISRSGE